MVLLEIFDSSTFLRLIIGDIRGNKSVDSIQPANTQLGFARANLREMCEFCNNISIPRLNKINGISTEIHFHRKLCLCEHISRWKLNGLNASIFSDAGRMIVYAVTSDFVGAIYFILFSFSGISLSVTPSKRNVGGVNMLKAWKEHSHENSIAFTYPQIHLSFCTICVAFSYSFCS